MQMKLIVITSEQDFPEEQVFLQEMMKRSELFRLHIRKPHWDLVVLQRFLSGFTGEERLKMSLHRHWEEASEQEMGVHLGSDQKIDQSYVFKGVVSKSCHNWAEVRAANSLDYVFLSPVFDSISKKGYRAAFDLNALEYLLKEYKYTGEVFALGGVSVDNLLKCRVLGFDGVAVFGSIWQQPSVNRAWGEFEKLCQLMHE